jgi:integrase
LNEVETLLASIDETTEAGARDVAIIRTMLGCACSELELASLDVGDIQKVGNQWYILVQGKGKSIKDERVPVPQTTIAALQKYIDRRKTKSSMILPPDTPVFLSYSNRSHGKRATVRGIREAIMIRLNASGVRKERVGRLTPFSLRHTAGILMVESGASVEELMQRMRIEWRPTAMLYFKQKGKLGSTEVQDAQKFIAL